MFFPTYYFKNLKQIPWEKLKEKLNIKVILLDKDNTLTKHKESEIMVDKETMEKVKQLFKVVMVVSNHEGESNDTNQGKDPTKIQTLKKQKKWRNYLE
jgi:predicted HAD superfamily phosphohydrolase YqeG